MPIFKLMRKVPFFAHFTREEKALLTASDNFFASFKDGETIIREGSTDHALFILIKGQVKIVKDIDPEHPVNILNSGAVFGEISFLTKRPRCANVIAQGHVMVFMLDREGIESLDLQLQSKIKDQLINVLVEHLDAMNKTLVSTITRML